MANEHPLLLGTEGNLVGIVTEPSSGVRPDGLGAIFVNAGVVHRVGPNRLYVNAARELADRGIVSARFDLPGIGDSPARRDATPFEQAAVEETRAAISRLADTYGVRRFILAGLCSGAVVSFATAVADDRVAGAVLINTQGFGASPELISYVVDRGQTRRYVGKIFSPRSWRRALTGRSDYGYALQMLSRRWKNRRPDSTVAKFSRGVAGSFRTLTDRGVAILLACSGGDYSLDYLSLIMGPQFRTLDRRGVRIVDLPAADHSLTLRRSQRLFSEALLPWADAVATAAEARTAAPLVARHEMAAASSRGSRQ